MSLLFRVLSIRHYFYRSYRSQIILITNKSFSMSNSIPDFPYTKVKEIVESRLNKTKLQLAKENVILIDVRPESEITSRGGPIPTALNIPCIC